uniref:Uncharacterized protein n=1 Tax=uncultured Flavobacteriia bacterium TaxID=212695 RepID=H6RDQ8_9BACT|nr:hypothetical protein VIS_S3ARA10035 [uncultured Flavobacteriia bacterium]
MIANLEIIKGKRKEFAKGLTRCAWGGESFFELLPR